jgi:serine/threonine protein kinase/Tol biopolymer transport system component
MDGSLTQGARLGPYEILSPLGAGGMGEVYKARDTRLGRDVAVKVLPPHLAGDDKARLRFQREAKAISALSHPHICTLHDVGSEAGTEYLVMELIEGESLAARLSRGPLPLAQALRIAGEIGGALDAAHRLGIVHRDLKPANVMLTPSGAKLLDFGLARLRERAPDAAFPFLRTEAETEADLTQAGTVLGTLSYMAPEQLEGRPSDSRADIFSFGAVVYETLTGRRAFAGESRAAVISSILTASPPPVTTIFPDLPVALNRIVGTCLAKDPEERWQNAADVGRQLKSLADGGPEAKEASAQPRGAQERWLPWVVAAMAAVAMGLAAVAVVRKGGPGPMPSAAVRFSIPPPPNGGFEFSVEQTFLAVSPDGSQLVYAASDSEGGQRLWLRQLGALDARPIAGTEGAVSVFWSPDGRSIGFFAGSKLKRLDLPAGAPVTICEVHAGGGESGTWGAGGEILFAPVQGEALYRVPASGGVPEPLIRPDRARGETRVCWPWFLPDGKRFLFVVRKGDGEGRLMFVEPGKPPRDVMAVDSVVQLAGTGSLVFVRDGVLLAQPFDTKTGRVSGTAGAIAEQIRFFLSTGGAAFATSGSGTLVYQSGRMLSRLVWFDRSGRKTGTVGVQGNYLNMAVAPDGRRILFDRTLPGPETYDVWSMDVERGVETRITTNSFTSEFGPLWLPDGKSIVYSATLETQPNLFRRDLATGKEEALAPAIAFQFANDVTRDGRTLVYSERTQRGNWDLMTLPLGGPGKPAALLPSSFNKANLTFSPDGDFIVFRSDESGRFEAYVAPFPGPGEVIRISTAGARMVRWSRDGREIFILSGDRRLVSLPVRTSPSLQVGAPVTLFEVTLLDVKGAGWNSFDVSPDGKRFLAIVPEVVADRLPLTVVVNGYPPLNR